MSTKGSSKALTRRLVQVKEQIERRAIQSQIIITTYWGNEEVPIEPGDILIRTLWNTKRLEDA